MAEQAGVQKAYGFDVEHARLTFFETLRPYYFSLLIGCALLLFTNLLIAYLPVLINAGVVLIETQQPFRISFAGYTTTLNFFALCGSIIGVAITGALVRTQSRRVLLGLGRSVERDVREELFFHLSTLDDAFFQKHSVGDLMNHLTSDMANIRMMAGFASLHVMNIVFVFIFTVPFLFKIDAALALCALLPFPLIMITTRSISRRMFQATLDYQQQQSKLVSHVQENLLGAHVVRLFHQQHNENERFAKTNQETFDAGIKLARVRVLMQPIMRLMVGLAVGLVLYVGGFAVASGRISVGDFVEINARILQIAWPAMSVGFVMSIVSRGQASLARINQLLCMKPAIVDGNCAVSPIQSVNVTGLSLTNLLTKDSQDGLTFRIKRGELLGIVGPSGSFKSTLLRALCRRVEVADGVIFFDDKDLKTIELASIYAEVAIVSDENFLFHKSIRENICFAKPDASSKDIAEVLALTRLDRDIATFGDGIDTIVGDRGITLSGGQRQRVALARALLAKRSIVILDDALSSVDAETERHIVERLRRYARESILIIATHRMSAVKDAERIVVLEHGRMVDTGTHDALLSTNRLYQQLWGLDQLQGLWT